MVQYNVMMLRSALTFALIVAIFAPLSSWADVIVRISSTPAYPGPNQQVTLTAHSVAQKGAYSYAWAVDGVLVSQGVDTDSLSITAGPSGSEVEVSVVLIDPQGNVTGSDSYTVRSGSVDVIWEGTTYVPPFYRGKAYPNGDSQIRLQAIPHISLADGSEVPDDSLVYTWEVDGQVLKSISGFGKSAISIKPASLRRSTAVTVTAQTRDGLFTAKDSVNIPTTNPRLVFYEVKPLGGVQFNQAVTDSFAFIGEEMTFWSVPFFINTPSAMKVSWTVNAKPFEVGAGNPYIATFRKTGVGTGAYTIGASMQRTGSIFEQAASAFKLSFE